MDYERGLAALEQFAQYAAWRGDFSVHEAALRENLRDERRYGPSEQTRRDRARIVGQLNRLALQHLGISFNDLCMGRQLALSVLQPIKGRSRTSPAAAPALNSGKAWAVVVGVDEYEDPCLGDLTVCAADAATIHEAIDRSCQVARLLTDATADRLPTRSNVLCDLSVVAQSTQEDDLLLFYFSGHGRAEDGESYLLPRDGRLFALKHTAVAMQDVRELMDKSPARAKVIVLDACHSGASIGKTSPAMTPEFIQRVFEEGEGMAVLASCKQGQLSWEWPEQGASVFTYYLLEALAGKADLDHKGFVTVSDASRYVTGRVKGWGAEHGKLQTPTLQYTVAGDIVLTRYA